MVVAVAAVALLASACTSSGPRSSSTATAPPSTPSTPAELSAAAGATTVPASFSDAPLGQPQCQPPSPVRAFEVRGTSDTAEIYGLISSSALRADEEIKIVWRMTGSGELSISVTGPSGESVPLTFGPERHAGSTYDRPGDEWGSGYRFTQPGCWHLHLERADSSGDVWLDVEP